MEKFNRLIKVMRVSLEDLDKAIHGIVLMSGELDAMFVNIQNGKVPDNWTKIGYLSMKPLASWFDDLIARCNFMSDWLINGQPNSYWISGFFFPQGFLTGVLQTHARIYKIPIDELSFSFQIQDMDDFSQVEEKPTDGVYVHGLFMDGARYNRDQKCIDE
jgi:dynein heavy chain, axonemal